MRATHGIYHIYALGWERDETHPGAMKPYVNPLACSLASRIVGYEAGPATELAEVDRVTRASDGTDICPAATASRVA
jgi:hypothetical protein